MNRRDHTDISIFLLFECELAKGPDLNSDSIFLQDMAILQTH